MEQEPKIESERDSYIRDIKNNIEVINSLLAKISGSVELEIKDSASLEELKDLKLSTETNIESLSKILEK